jgi:CRISPR-associated protein Cmr1
MSSRVVQATFRIVTPLFLGGAEPKKSCEVRGPSIKGAMLFWWRALRPGVPLADLRRQESELFGSSRGGQSRWLLDAREEKSLHLGKLELDQGRGYLAGQGLAQLKQAQPQTAPRRRPLVGVGTAQPMPYESTRRYLRPGGRITLRAFRRTISRGASAEAEQIRAALVALATFGGLGARSRRGFGSIHLEELTWGGEHGQEALEEPKDVGALQGRLSSLLGAIAHSSLPPYSCFSNDARVLVLDAPGKSAEDLHEELGRRFKDFRSHERSGGVGEADHDDMVEWLRSGKPDVPPRRAVFGLPHNYYFSSTNAKVGVNASGKLNRRASPLFLHLDELGEEGERHGVAVLTFLPAAFLPARAKIVVKGEDRRGQMSLRPYPDIWRPIHEWLDDLKNTPPFNATAWERP